MYGIGTAVVLVGGTLLIVCVRAKPQAGHVYDAETNCFEQHPSINRDFVEELKRSRKLPENPTMEFKCFIACVGKKLMVMNHGGDLHFDELKKLTVQITAGDASHDDAHDMVSKCIAVDDDNNCEKAYKYVECKIVELRSYKLAKDFCPSCEK